MAEDTVKRFGQGAEEIWTGFVGTDGKTYNIQIHGDRIYVNGAKMLSLEDGPCEYAGNCMGNNQNCSYKGRNLKAPRGERCTLYDDRKDAEEAVKQERAQ